MKELFEWTGVVCLCVTMVTLTACFVGVVINLAREEWIKRTKTGGGK